MKPHTAALRIRRDDLIDPRIAEFLQAHLADMRRISPPESVHALDLDALRQPDIQFWTAWLDKPEDSALVATAALKRLTVEHAELKSMRTDASLRNQGVGARMLAHVLGAARDQGFRRISLETGSQSFFAPAHALYAANGFADCSPFGDYRLDPHSRFMTLWL